MMMLKYFLQFTDEETKDQERRNERQPVHSHTMNKQQDMKPGISETKALALSMK